MTEHADALWMTVAAVLTLVANVGVFVVGQGLTRSRSVSTLVAHQLAHLGAAILSFAMIGYGLTYGDGNTWFGTEWFGLSGVDLADRVAGDDGPTHGALLAWHLAVAALLSSTVLAAVAERARVVAHVAVGAIVGGGVHPLAVRAAGPDGLLDDISIGGRSFVDAGGSVVLFAVAGWMALVGAMIVGPRIGRFGSRGQPRVIPGRSLPLAVGGGLVMLAGWAGVAGGNLREWSDDVPRAVVLVFLGGASGALGAAYSSWVRTGQAGAAGTVRGLIAGAVAVSAGVVALSTTWAIVVAFIGGGLVPIGGALVERAKLDDPFGVIVVFAGAGTWGALAVGLFATDSGLLDSASPDLLLAQLAGVLILASWAIVAGAAAFGVLRALGRVRLDEDEELVGLSLAEQDASGVPDRSDSTADDPH